MTGLNILFKKTNIRKRIANFKKNYEVANQRFHIRLAGPSPCSRVKRTFDNKMELITNYSQKEVINILRENTHEVKSFITLNPFNKFARMQRAMVGIIEEDSFEVGISPLIIAHGRLTPSNEGTNIKIKFVKNILFIAGFFRWKYEREIISEFLLKLFQPDKNQNNCKEDIFVFSKAAIPEKDKEAFQTKQNKICSAIAGKLVNDIPESWYSATLEIISINGELSCSIHSSNEKCNIVTASAELVNEANKLRKLFYDIKQYWKSAILTIYWDHKTENWRFEIDYKY